MKPRIRRILDVLIDRDGFVPVPELAAAIGAGVRTVFRDIQELEFLLRDYGAVIEKRRSVGIRLLGDVTALRSRGHGVRSSASTRLPDLSSGHRQLATLLYLGHTDRVVKLNELATLFFVSDSCVSGDLKELDGFLELIGSPVTLDRQRGIGVSLSGPEWDIRMALLRAARELIHPQELIQYALLDSSNDRPRRVLDVLGFAIDRNSFLEAIGGAESRLGYRFSWGDFGLLFLYLALLSRRTRFTPSLDRRGLDISPSVPESAARGMWAALDLGDPPDDEIYLLALFLSSLEPGEIRESNRCLPDVDRIVSSLLVGLERDTSPAYAFDGRLFYTLRVGISSLVYKKMLRVPRADATDIPLDSPDRIASQATVSQLHGILAPIIAALYGIAVRPEELAAIYLTVRAAEESMSAPRRKFRVLVTCFEGIFLAQFISSILRAHFPEVTVVSALSCDRASDAWIRANAIDLVVTTFPSGLTAAPEYVIASPFEAAPFRAEMTGILSRLSRVEAIPFAGETAGEASSVPDGAIDAAMQIVSNFAFVASSDAGPSDRMTQRIARLACPKDAHKAATLQADLDRRELLGPVNLEDSGIRLYHCRSRAVSEPRAGVIGSNCFLIAPEDGNQATVQALSRVSVALIENAEFTRAILLGDFPAVKRNLFAILAAGI